MNPHPSIPVYSIGHENRHDVTYVIIFTLLPGKEETFLSLIEPVLNAMRNESTFRNAVLHRDPLKPNRFMLYESWSDANDVINTQIHRDYRQDFWAGLPGLLENDRDIQTWTPIRGDFALVH
ncbi:antibiotic biosynthesis monooxygenase [Pollutimonas subterranea]|uniref:Antibiotic biosynthesis monooxygenase n=1 Tax=Pollutimonas subterranea TaxID=2045210 RepID=A0A2N4U161_9BURK|nr:antibiotic biosynthesis monooxygenase [Pollutimonas subterranea]PLC48740.1 antibiotic biosynthesis monooxygenase [Pollutimonas subterranea]